MARDAIIDEVRAVREAFAKEHGCDAKAMVRTLQKEQAESGRSLVSFKPKRLRSKRRGPKAG